MRHVNEPRKRDARLIAASELACFAYCPEQWRLEYGLGLPAQNRAATNSGTRHHRRKAMAERLAGLLLAVGQLLAIFAILGLAWLLWRSW